MARIHKRQVTRKIDTGLKNTTAYVLTRCDSSQEIDRAHLLASRLNASVANGFGATDPLSLRERKKKLNGRKLNDGFSYQWPFCASVCMIKIQ